MHKDTCFCLLSEVSKSYRRECRPNYQMLIEHISSKNCKSQLHKFCLPIIQCSKKEKQTSKYNIFLKIQLRFRVKHVTTTCCYIISKDDYINPNCGMHWLEAFKYLFHFKNLKRCNLMNGEYIFLNVFLV